jgi:DNA-binding MarR family transcriptional regulator
MNADQLAQVRSFNRLVTQRVGALEDDFLGRGRPLGQARLLYEIGRQGAEVGALRRRLGLDSGYVSRLLRSLEKQGLVVSAPTERDGRRRVVRLSSKGCRELAGYGRCSDAFAEAMLEHLSDSQRARLVGAMAEVERLLVASGIQLAIEPPDSDDAAACFRLYFDELDRRFDAGFDPARSISARADELSLPAGLLVLARSMGKPVACGALKVKGSGIGELKRMWVDSSVRGLGLGRRILAKLEDEARRLGLKTLRLETNRNLKEAQSLYRQSGYREVKAFNNEPYAHHWFEKSLG